MKKLTSAVTAIMSTAIGFKLFRRNKVTGEIFPLYVRADESIPVGAWVEAQMGEIKENGKVKAKDLSEVALRGGWHLNEECPYVEHIYSKVYCEDGYFEEKGKHFDRIHKQGNSKWEYVWYEVEYETTVDCQPMANEAGRNAKGEIIAKNAQLEMVDKHGYYRYKTNPNMFGTWIIAGNIRLVRELDRETVLEKCAEYGLKPLPTKGEYKSGARFVPMA